MFVNEWDPVSSSYPAALRVRAEQLVGDGHSVQEVARQLGVSVQTVYRWRRVRVSASELARARARIDELEGEIDLLRQAIAVMKQVVPPKGGTR
ncbi:transposase [Streptomyces spiralis]|uniref:transposase n=1 Tax=Streptomyces spiralis TaxID=66376 RepID=UPI0036A8F398